MFCYLFKTDEAYNSFVVPLRCDFVVPVGSSKLLGRGPYTSKTNQIGLKFNCSILLPNGLFCNEERAVTHIRRKI